MLHVCIIFSLTLKKVTNIYDSDDDNSTIAKNVLNPPFHTAGPISLSAFDVLSKN